ncbi:MAG: hypothetical protein HKN94_16260, partial [Acidimicrobiales bacterium]|nr:hypothetical protein [Acidimicrobiales bacterium]
GIVAMLLLVPSRILGELIANGVDQLRATTVPAADTSEPADHVSI